MDFIHYLTNFIMHLDKNLVVFVASYGTLAYFFLFLIIFCETGLVVTPILPGDSLLFAAGALAATASLNIHVLFVLLVGASVLGNTSNYFIGRFVGPKIFHSRDSWLFNRKYLGKAHHFYEKFGGKTIILARFIPIIRTFAPFIAGIGEMDRLEFFCYNLIGAVLWVGSLLSLSYLFGNLPTIKEHFSTVMIAIIALSLTPPLIEILRQRCLPLRRRSAHM
jgi:membrane-associated protein